MGAGAFFPLAVFVLVVGSVGWRLLALWRRSQRVPELLLGLGLVLMSCVAIPLAGVGRLPATSGTLLGKTCFATSLASVAVAVVLLIAFTQRVFRPGARWAVALFVAVSIAAAAAAGWTGWVNFAGDSIDEIVVRMRPGSMALLGSLFACFAWASGESLLYHANLKRRLAYGLADPVLVDRFFLWGVSAGATSALLGVLLYFVQSGMVLLRETVSLTAIALVGTLMSTAWYLTFLAPASYLERVRKRAERA
jgi:hypothetical protein